MNDLSSPTNRRRTMVSWSSGKDSAWMLHQLSQDSTIEVAGLLTTINDTHDRVAMHGVRREVVEAQATAAGLPMTFVPLPWPCPNGVYEKQFAHAVDQAQTDGITHMAFGDLYLEDIRDYRIALLEGTDIEPLFPTWCGRNGTASLAREMVDSGIRAIVSCLDPKRLDRRFAGRAFDADLLAELPDEIDPCAENGEFHTVCTHGPCYSSPLNTVVGECVERDGYYFADVLLSS